jgi:hypothetical protein
MSKLALFRFRFIGQDAVRGGGLAGNDKMCDLIVRQGPQGRRQTVRPSPEGLGYRWRMIPGAVGAALYRSAPR